MTQFLTSSLAKNIKHATYFIIANQQNQQNPVNELSCTNLYTLVCFLRATICGSFFMVHSVQTICTSLEIDNHTNTLSLSFYRPDALPDAHPIVSKH